MNFTPAAIIQKKRDGKQLTDREIKFLIEGITTGTIADYQATAFLMATYFKGMTSEETASFTQAMKESGKQFNFSDLKGAKVDKHSTGGIGDKVSLVLAPLAAACGLIVPMMAGRGLGHTGGTIDKLESIPGYKPQLSEAETRAILKEVGCVIIGQSELIAPADRKLYALRDVTATVDCIPLIVGSILSKKIAEGADSLVLDVKVGNGAFMKTKDQAKQLAKALIAVGKKSNLKIRALLTNMDQPLGDTVGNTLEVLECIELLKDGKGPADLKEITIQLCAHMLELGGTVKTLAQGRKLALDKLANGEAWARFIAMIEKQGGDISYLKNPEKFKKAPKIVEWRAHKRGYISKMNNTEIGQMLVELGGGRKKTSDTIDPTVGFIFHKKLGAKVQAGELLVTAHLPSNADAQNWEDRFLSTIEIRNERKPVPKLILDTL